jgi:hypothetical protein
MFKTISAALVAASVIAAPAFAATSTRTAHSAPITKAEHVKSRVLNANAMMRHHHVHHYHHHYRHHTAIKAPAKIGFKHSAGGIKRG